MKRMLVATMVLGLLTTAAPAVITHSVSLIGTYTLGLGSAPVIDVYKVSFDAGPDRVVGALVFWLGAYAGDPNLAQAIPVDPNDPNVYNDPFQAGWRLGGKTPLTQLTPTRDDANAILLPPDSSKCYETDSSFLPPGIGTYPVGTVSPMEFNDGSIYAPGDGDYRAGVGSMGVAKAIPEFLRTRTVDAIMVGVIRGTTVYCYSGSADDLGNTTKERFKVYVIPEPATLGLLGVGALGLLRRRRR